MKKRFSIKDIKGLGLSEVSPNVFRKVKHDQKCTEVSRKRDKISKKRNKVECYQDKKDLFIISVLQELHLNVTAEYMFHPERLWRFDYAIISCKIAIEVEGGVWTQGRHTRGKGYIADMEKYNEAVALGWRLIRVTPQQLNKRYTLNQIKKIINN